MHEKQFNRLERAKLGIGLSYSFIKSFFAVVSMLAWNNITATLIIYLLLVTAPLVYLLGQTVPITLNLYKQQHTISNKTTIPAHLLTKEYFTAIKHALKPDGIAVFNIIARPTLADAYSKRIDNTIRSVFKNCMATPLAYTDQPENIIYVCKKTASEKDAMVYTDNKNRATLDAW